MSNINKPGIGHRTALFEAVAYDKIDTVRRFLEKSADPNIPDVNGTTCLMNAASCNNEAMVKLLISHKADIHFKDNFGDDAAQYARAQGHEQLAESLEKLKAESK
jgi:ankyrin repeat protein